MKQVLIKKYYRFEFQLMTALNIGSGENYVTDGDITKRRSGIPYIPGSAMAGIFRRFMSEDKQKKYFGDVIKVDEENKTAKSEDSKVITYDAELLSENYRISSRDCVKLDEYKTAVTRAKFDFQILEPGVNFVTYLEQDFDAEKSEDIGAEIAKKWQDGRVSFGSKTMRGLGETKLVKAEWAEFVLTDKEDLKRWLSFDLFVSPKALHSENNHVWTEIKIVEENALEATNCIGASALNGSETLERRIQLALRQKGGISVRRYSTAVGTENSSPDYEQLNYVRQVDNQEQKVPVIPGTTWAGAFRRRMENLIPGCVGDYFGTIGSKKDKISASRSKIRFGESEIENGKFKMITRNAIDRFTNATIDGALYTECAYYNGTTKLDISIDASASNDFRFALAAAIVDLHMGFLSIGGLTAVGRGIFEIEKIIVDGFELEKIKADRKQKIDFTEKSKQNIQGIYNALCQCLTVKEG